MTRITCTTIVIKNYDELEQITNLVLEQEQSYGNETIEGVDLKYIGDNSIHEKFNFLDINCNLKYLQLTNFDIDKLELKNKNNLTTLSLINCIGSWNAIPNTIQDMWMISCKLNDKPICTNLRCLFVEDQKFIDITELKNLEELICYEVMKL